MQMTELFVEIDFESSILKSKKRSFDYYNTLLFTCIEEEKAIGKVQTFDIVEEW